MYLYCIFYLNLFFIVKLFASYSKMKELIDKQLTSI